MRTAGREGERPPRPQALEWMALPVLLALFVTSGCSEGGGGALLQVLGLAVLGLALLFIVPLFVLQRRRGRERRKNRRSGGDAPAERRDGSGGCGLSLRSIGSLFSSVLPLLVMAGVAALLVEFLAADRSSPCARVGLSLPAAPGVSGESRDPEDPRAEEEMELRLWGERARALILLWYPRIVNLLPTRGFVPPSDVELVLSRTYDGYACTQGSTITVSVAAIRKDPDPSVVIHELTHVIQAYPQSDPKWIWEGIADYMEYAVACGFPLSWFPRPKGDRGYRRGYKDAAGFLLWLESGIAPGIVKRLNTAMRRGTYDDSLFQWVTGCEVDRLWEEYRRARNRE